MIYHRPSREVGHFLQSILPHVEINCHYGEAILSTTDKAKKEGKFILKIKSLRAPPIWIQALDHNDQFEWLVTFSTTSHKFMEKVTIINEFISKIIRENAQLTR